MMRWIVRKTVMVAVLAVVGNLVVKSVPDISRYLKMRAM
jgi:hypothetical protein